MGTRASISITSPGHPPIWLYRHYDGHPGAVGRDLARAIRGREGRPGYDGLPGGLALAIVDDLIQERWRGRPIYEIAYRVADDIDWQYDVMIDFLVRTSVRVIGGHGASVMIAPDQREFRIYVAQELRDTRVRAKALMARLGWR